LFRALLALLAATLLLCAVVLISTYTFLPLLLENLVARDLQNRLGLSERPEVDLTSDPPPNVLLGRFEEGKVSITNPELGGVRPDKATVDFRPFDLDMLGSLASGRIRGEGPLSGALRVELSEEEVARLASSSAPSVRVTGVELGEGYLAVGSEVEILGARVPVRVEGDFDLRDGELRFEPSRLEALGAAVPRQFTQDMLRVASFAYPVEIPFGEVSGVELREDRLVLTGEVEDLSIE
jgi:LmeA-like phospholipid-binding